MNTDDFLVAPVVKAERYETLGEVQRLVWVKCPWCNKRHMHGVEALLRGRLGHRVSHCHQGDGYVIVDNSPVQSWERVTQ